MQTRPYDHLPPAQGHHEPATQLRHLQGAADLQQARPARLPAARVRRGDARGAVAAAAAAAATVPPPRRPRLPSAPHQDHDGRAGQAVRLARGPRGQDALGLGAPGPQPGDPRDARGPAAPDAEDREDAPPRRDEDAEGAGQPPGGGQAAAEGGQVVQREGLGPEVCGWEGREGREGCCGRWRKYEG